jgi:hypothetical protein
MAQSKSQYIPTAAISTNGAELLSKTLKKIQIKILFKQSCETMEDVLSYNVIGEIKEASIRKIYGRGRTS